VLVEDHLDTRQMYCDSLTFAGFNVATARDAEGGYQLAMTLLPSIVVTDFRLPGASGAELCNRLKRHELTAKIPTLLVTASSQRRDVEHALAHGCAVVRLKPYLPDELERDVRALLAGDELKSWPAEHDAQLP
jgi:two-component system phosphate regulon response regulator PhoB